VYDPSADPPDHAWPASWTTHCCAHSRSRESRYVVVGTLAERFVHRRYANEMEKAHREVFGE